MNLNKLKRIKDFNSLAHFLYEELQWPIDPDNIHADDLSFEYSAEEIGLNEEYAAKVKGIKQIQPLDANQPWSIFWIDFENKKLPLTVLRRILNAFVVKKRGSKRNLATKSMEDIMFISGHGEDRNRAITFAHFKMLDGFETIREFYWDKNETKFDNITKCLEFLTWPENTKDVNAWRDKWKNAFTGSTREAITTSGHLATAMAGIARNIKDRVLEVLSVERKNGPVHKLYNSFREALVHDMTEDSFADMYAQTITYGLFSARTMDIDGHFELHEVVDLIPHTNPFLKELFSECLKVTDNKHKINLDELGVGILVDLFDGLNRSDGTDTMQRILAEFGRQTASGSEDPVIHFYEGFLSEYDKTQKVEKGVFYTPDPVVSFIVRSVHEQLKSDFGLEMGLADTTTWAEMVSSGRAEYPVDPKTGKMNNEWKEKIKGRAFVQILDPATGTGTFLKHVIEVVHEEIKEKFKRNKIRTDWIEYWNYYVYNDLLPRIYGFELMMAPYSIAHMKLGMYLKSLDYKFEKNQRLNIYLTNSLEPYTANTQVEFSFKSIGKEAAGANHVKQFRYFSVVLGNPPYSGISKNNDPWIANLIDNYKYIDGEHFNERKHWLNDDYVKFIRFGHHFIDKNCGGVLAYINNHSFLDNPTFRGMRWSLLTSFDKIYIIDLHGNNLKEEVSPDGTTDENVFDIQAGVSINLFIKTGGKKKDKLAEVKHADIWGNRERKYHYLFEESLETISFKNVNYKNPFYFLVPKDFTGNKEYEMGFRINELFPNNVTGVVTMGDGFIIAETKEMLKKRLSYFKENRVSVDWLDKEFGLGKNYAKWILKNKSAIKIDNTKFILFDYRPFDTRWTYFDNKLLWRWRVDTMQHFLRGENLGLMTCRQTAINSWEHVGITKLIADDSRVSNRSRERGYIFPLYIYPESQGTLYYKQERMPNLNIEKVEKIAKALGLEFTNEKENKKNTFAAIDLLDYIYAILHSPSYREKYKEFLKIDFPIIPFPKDLSTFWKLVKLGGELRQIHLLESDTINDFITDYPVKGSNAVDKIKYETKKVWINETQYFAKVPLIAWEFYVGGYQPAQKWLKDRKERKLSKEDIAHYQKIIVALTETDRIMKEIDKIEIE